MTNQEHNMTTANDITAGTRISYENAVSPRAYARVTRIEDGFCFYSFEEGTDLEHAISLTMLQRSLDRVADGALAGWRVWTDEETSPRFEIQIQWSENPELAEIATEHGGTGHTFTSFADFQAAVARIEHTLPEHGGYDKTRFVIRHLDSCDSYDGRLDMQHPARDTADNDLLRHVRQACQTLPELPWASEDDKANCRAWADRFENAQ